MVDHPVDAQTLGALHDLGVTRVVLPETAVVANQSTGPVLVPSSRGSVTAAATGFFDLTGTGPDDPVLAAHQLYARLAATGSISSSTAGLTVRIDPAKVDPTQLQVLLAGLAKGGPFLRPTTLAQLFDEVAPAPAPATLAPVRAAPLTGYAAQLGTIDQLLASYQSMVPDRPQVSEAFRQPLATTASADLSASERNAQVDGIEHQLRSRFAGISTPEEDRVTLGARRPLPAAHHLEARRARQGRHLPGGIGPAVVPRCHHRDHAHQRAHARADPRPHAPPATRRCGSPSARPTAGSCWPRAATASAPPPSPGSACC
ncbi:hypothetical protein KSP35_15830 [Aquihabitans sp. G128]|uniref:hypothetical protein n=1 Tax=Aquihabitans sp. G128 TaxID=2849779 RepID=UPI001C21264C|nr:hypothetical protein [Aquihabitans sp. G128]QXC59837.1 hypothetical protein KSP35_15830 [Aquihabitans sp. G128]